MALVKVCLRANYFSFDGKLYFLRRGLAMGSRLAPLLAIIFMGALDAQVLRQRPILYFRYIDDTFVVTATPEGLQSLFDLLNSLHPHIHFTREAPHEG